MDKNDYDYDIDIYDLSGDVRNQVKTEDIKGLQMIAKIQVEGTNFVPSVKLPLPCAAYVGMEPYIFVSYDHVDRYRVYPEIKILYNLGYRIWYDEGINPSNEWPEEIARAIDASALFIIFISENAVQSQNIKNEIHFALNRRKPFLAIHLEKVSLPEGLELRMGDIQAILKWRMFEDDYIRKIEKVLPNACLRKSKQRLKPGPLPENLVTTSGFNLLVNPPQAIPQKTKTGTFHDVRLSEGDTLSVSISEPPVKTEKIVQKVSKREIFITGSIILLLIAIITTIVWFYNQQMVNTQPPRVVNSPNIVPTMIRVSGVTRFPIETEDSGSCTTVNYPYEIGETEVTFGQWSAVNDWALKHEYSIALGGRGGYMDLKNDEHIYNEYDTGHMDHPVTRVSWNDAMVWCNALTEYCNNVEGTNYSCVYLYNGAIIRDAFNTSIYDKISVVGGAKGFRLPTSMEWELAARYIDGKRWTPGAYASGAYNNINNIINTTGVAWFRLNSGKSTHQVATKAPNTLGIYDMSGNVWEWCFDWYPGKIGSDRVIRGGSWDSLDLEVGSMSYDSPSQMDEFIGFRLVRTL